MATHEDSPELVDLQMRVAFLDDTVAKLDLALANQQQQLLEQRRLIELMATRLQELEAGAGNPIPDPPPPHY